MDSEDKKMLRENLKFSKDNHKILKNLQSHMRWGRIVKFAYWLIIIAGTLGAYYYIQPFIDSARDTLTQMQTGVETVSQGASGTTSIITKIIEPVLNFGKNILGQ